MDSIMYIEIFITNLLAPAKKISGKNWKFVQDNAKIHT